MVSQVTDAPDWADEEAQRLWLKLHWGDEDISKIASALRAAEQRGPAKTDSISKGHILAGGDVLNLLEGNRGRDVLTVASALQRVEERTRSESAARIADLEKALRPFAACVFNDNGDVTYSTGHLTRQDYRRAAALLHPKGWGE